MIVRSPIWWIVLAGAVWVAQPVVGIDAANMPNIYSNDDLILANPQQSTAIFLTVIVASTALELFLGTVAKRRNLYFRMMVEAVKEEITVLGFCIMALQFAVSSFPDISAAWKTVAEWVTICLVYISIGYVALVLFLAPQMKRRAQAWRTFEWARIDSDSHHSATEEIFKLSRRYFVAQLTAYFRFHGEEVTNVPPVALSSFSYYRSIAALKEVFDFSLKTWIILGLFVLLNAMRTITMESLDGSTILAQTLTFLIIIGYLVLLLQVALAMVLERRLRRFLIQQLSPDTVKPDSDSMGCLFLNSSSATLELNKGFILTSIWFFVYFMLAYVSASYNENGLLCILFVALALPPPIGVILLTPWTIHTVSVCEALSPTNRDAAIEHLEGGCVIADDIVDETSLEDPDGIVHSNQNLTELEPSGALNVVELDRADRELEGVVDDEFNGPTLNLGVMIGEEVGMRRTDVASNSTGTDAPASRRANHSAYITDEYLRQPASAASVSRSRGLSVNHFGHRREAPPPGGDPSRVYDAPVSFWEPR